MVDDEYVETRVQNWGFRVKGGVTIFPYIKDRVLTNILNLVYFICFVVHLTVLVLTMSHLQSHNGEVCRVGSDGD